MRSTLMALFLLSNLHAHASSDLSMQEWLDLFVDSCVGSGSSFLVSGSADANAALSLKKMRLDGALAGQVKVERSSYRLLAEGISNAMTNTAADQADRVRECLTPVRRTLLEAMNRQMGANAPTSSPIYILSHPEELVMKALGSQRGHKGETGKLVPMQSILSTTGLSDLRLRIALRELQAKLLASDAKFLTFEGSGAKTNPVHVSAVSLWDRGEEYVVKMGYSK